MNVHLSSGLCSTGLVGLFWREETGRRASLLFKLHRTHILGRGMSANPVIQTGLVSLDQFVVPTLVVGGAKRAMGAAFRVLTESIQQDLIPNTATHASDYRPLVFLLTSGSPTDR